MLLFILITLFVWGLGWILPWWSAVLPGILFGAVLARSGISAFLLGGAGAGLAWGVQAVYIHFANDGILTERIADVMQVGEPLLVILITLLIGSLLGAVSTLCGYFAGSWKDEQFRK
ncbi:MAG: hypothetical protein ACOC4S_00580 [Balneolaceae bacterium]